MDQLANIMAERLPGKSPSTTEVNPKERAMAITLRNGKELKEAARV